MKKITAGLILEWLLGALLIVRGLGLLEAGSIVKGIIVLLCLILIVPPLEDWVSKRSNLKISSGVKVVIFLIVFFGVNSVGGNHESIGKVMTDSTLEKECPDIVKTGAYRFSWSESMGGNKNLYLQADFLSQFAFSDSWKLSDSPASWDNFVCEKGSKTGESVNKLYCTPTIGYKPKLQKNTVNEKGDIISTDYRYLKSFIFDITGKDINNNVDLGSSKLDGITCSTSNY